MSAVPTREEKLLDRMSKEIKSGLQSTNLNLKEIKNVLVENTKINDELNDINESIEAVSNRINELTLSLIRIEETLKLMSDLWIGKNY